MSVLYAVHLIRLKYTGSPATEHLQTFTETATIRWKKSIKNQLDSFQLLFLSEGSLTLLDLFQRDLKLIKENIINFHYYKSLQFLDKYRFKSVIIPIMKCRYGFQLIQIHSFLNATNYIVMQFKSVQISIQICCDSDCKM